MKVFENRRLRSRAPRYAARLLISALGVPYLLTPAAAWAGPPKTPKPPVNKNWVIDKSAWDRLQTMMAQARTAEAEGHREEALKQFEAIADAARRCKYGQPEYDDGNLYPPGGRSGNNDYIPDVYFTPRLARGYAEFEIGRLSTDADARRNAFSEAGAELYLDALPEATQGNLAKEYRLPAIQLIALLGQLENLRGYLNKEANRKKFDAIVTELSKTLDEADKEKQKKETLKELTADGKVGSLLLWHTKDEDAGKTKTHAQNFLDEVRATLAEEINLPKETEFVLEPGKGNQYKYAFPENIAPVSLALNVDGREAPLESLSDSADTRDADPKLRSAKLFFAPEYAKLAEKLHPGAIKKEQKERALTWTQREEPMTASVAGGSIQTSLLEIAKGAVAFHNVKKGDVILVSANIAGNEKPLGSVEIKEDAENYNDFSLPLPPFGASATVALSYKRKDKTESLIGPIALRSTARPEAQAGLAANYGAVGLMLIRCVAFEKPSSLRVNGVEQRALPPIFAQSLPDEQTGRSVYWMAVYSGPTAPAVSVDNVAASTSKQIALTLPADVKEKIQAGLIGDLKIAEAPQTLTAAQRLALLKSDLPEIQAMLPALYKNVPQLDALEITALMAKVAVPEIKPVLSDIYDRKSGAALGAQATPDQKIAALKELTALAAVADRVKENAADIARLAVPPPPKELALVNVKAWRSADGIAFVTYDIQNFDKATTKITLATVNGYTMDAVGGSGAGFAALQTTASDVALRIQATQNGKSFPMTKRLKAAASDQPVPAALKDAVTKIRQIAKGEISLPADLTVSDGQEASLLAGRALQQNVNAAALPALKDIKSEAEVTQAAAALGTPETNPVYGLLVRLKAKDMILGEALSTLSAYEGAEQNLQAARQLRNAQANLSGSGVVTVETWAEPKMLRLDGKPIAPEPTRQGACLVFQAKPGTPIKLSLSAAPTEIALVDVPEPPKLENYTVVIGSKDKLISLSPGDERSAVCHVAGGAKDGLVYKWKLTAGEKELAWPGPPADSSAVTLTAAILQTIDAAGGAATLTASVYKGAKQVAADSAELKLNQPKAMAFVVGIEDYDGKGRLPYIASDANDFADKLIKLFGYPPDSIYRVTASGGAVQVNGVERQDRLSTLSTKVLENEFAKFLARARNAGAKHFIIYYSGHGETNESGEDQLKLPDGGTIWAHEWADQLLKLSEKEGQPLADYTVVGLYQACRDGGGVRLASNGGNLLGTPAKNARYFALPSCAAGFQTNVDRAPKDPLYLGINHGYFGEAVLDALDSLAGGSDFSPVKLFGSVDYLLAGIIKNANEKVAVANKKEGASVSPKFEQQLPPMDTFPKLSVFYQYKK